MTMPETNSSLHSGASMGNRKQKRRKLTEQQRQSAESMADDLLHSASGAGVTRDIDVVCKALGWPKLTETRTNVMWSNPRQNAAECYRGDLDHVRFERLAERGWMRETNRWNDGLIEYEVTPLGKAVAFIRHMAIREALKVLE